MRKITQLFYSSGENRLDGEHPKDPILLPDSDLCIWNIVGCEYRQKCEKTCKCLDVLMIKLWDLFRKAPFF